MAGAGLALGYDSDADKRRYARQLMLEGSSTAPVQHWTQALARVLQGAMGGYELGQIEKDDQDATAALKSLPGLSPAPQTTAPAGPAATPTATPADAVASVESGGKYDALGPVTKNGDRAYGKYQVMGSNVGPWTKQYVGQEMTPEQFLANPQAQDAVFKGQFGQYMQKYGSPEAAARAWFAGEGNMNNLNATDQLGTSVGQYGKIVSALTAPGTAPATAGPAPQLSPTGQRIAAALGGRPSVSIPPDVAASISALIGNPRTQAQGLALYSQYARPSDYGFQTLPDGTILRTDSRTGTVQPIYQGATRPTFNVIGENADGSKQYGFINPTTGVVTPYSLPATSGGNPGTVTGPNGQPIEIPPGSDVKEFRKRVSDANADAATGKMTEVQAKASSYAARMEQAQSILNKLEGEGTSYWGNLTEHAPLVGGTAATNWMQSNNYQNYKNAASAYITALLRQESGAAINKDEFNRYAKEHMPQPGDSSEVIRQKRLLRDTAIEQMKRAAGPGYKSPELPTAFGNATKTGVRWSVE